METPQEHPPSRPGWKTLLLVVGAIIAVEMAYNWSDISAFAHLPEIAHSMGLD